MRVGIVGTSMISELFLEGARAAGVQVTAVCSRDEARCADFAAKHGITHSFTDLNAFAESNAFDAAYVASPNALHAEQSIRLLQAKKHVLCEKSIASNYSEFARMKKTAEENGVLLLEAMRPVHAPFLELVRAQLPRLGTVRRVSLVYNQYSSRYDNFRRGVVENAFDPRLSNGALMDIGVYCVQMLVFLFGAPDRIHSAGVKLPGSIDGQGCILAEYDGMLAELSYSKISDGVAPSVIQGEEGSLAFQPLTKPRSTQLHLRKQPPVEILVEDSENNMVYEIEHFVQMIADRAKAQKYVQCTDSSMRILDEVRRQQGIVFPADRET